MLLLSQNSLAPRWYRKAKSSLWGKPRSVQRSRCSMRNRQSCLSIACAATSAHVFHSSVCKSIREREKKKRKRRNLKRVKNNHGHRQAAEVQRYRVADVYGPTREDVEDAQKALHVDAPLLVMKHARALQQHRTFLRQRILHLRPCNAHATRTADEEEGRERTRWLLFALHMV